MNIFLRKYPDSLKGATPERVSVEAPASTRKQYGGILPKSETEVEAVRLLAAGPLLHPGRVERRKRPTQQVFLSRGTPAEFVFVGG